MDNPDRLLDKAKDGTLSKQEIDFIANWIRNFEDGDDEDGLYTMIHALGRAFVSYYGSPVGNPQKYRADIERFLEFPSFPSVSSIALRTLCACWGYTQDYLPQLKELIQGVEWDEDGGVALTSIGLAGEYLRETSIGDKELLQLLLAQWETHSSDAITSVHSEALYEALARASGQEWKELLSDDDKPNTAVLNGLRELTQ